jgi:D-ornithine---citrate ligase
VTALTTFSDPTAAAAAAAEAVLAEVAPALLAGFRESLPHARDVVSRRLVGAAYREGLTGGPDVATWAGGQAFLPMADGGYLVARADRHPFERLEVTEPLLLDPARLLRRLAGGRASPVEAELTDATINLALAYARNRSAIHRPAIHTSARDLVDLWRELDPDTRCVHFERLATDGHNLHPCGRTRLGWSVPDLLAYDLETPAATVGFVGVRRDVHVGDEVGPELIDRRLDGYAISPVHPWQLRHIRARYGDVIRPLDEELPALVTGALRTLLLPDRGRYVKLSLDIQVTSTRRTISVASTRNGPALSRLLARLLPDRVLLLAETAGSALVSAAGDRDLAAILRSGLSGQLGPDEVAVPGSALYATSPVTGTSVVAELVRRSGLAAPGWLEAYARLLLPAVLGLATRHGIGLEAHLQNCVPTFVDGRPHRLALRDLAGMRLYPGRLDAPLWTDLGLWPGSVIVADDVDVMRAKVAYTAVQAHLGEIVIRLGESHGLDEPTAWAAIRSIVDEVYAGLAAEPGLAERSRADHAFLTAPTVPHKALLRMRLAAVRGQGGDRYVQVGNPLR